MKDIELEEQHHQMTLEAIADAEAGRVIDHKAVVEWANSLGTKNSPTSFSPCGRRWCEAPDEGNLNQLCFTQVSDPFPPP